ncbi:MAG TPA: XRE family transcriptional regulator [Micromonosporaceae bacterium]|nr:XRE family transcriptional regulator [Micromonosporaceae bacterium]
MSSPEPPPVDTGADLGIGPACTLAHKINYLFETVRRPDGKPYSNEEVAESINGRGETTISGTYLWYLRRGDRDNPTKQHLEVLARFFDVSPAFFFDDERSRRVARQTLPAAPPTEAQRVAVRLDGLSPRSLRTVGELIDRVRELEGLPPDGPAA